MAGLPGSVVIMEAEMAPDVYGGPKCDQVIPRWRCWAEGDMDGPGAGPDPLVLRANEFPPGARVVVTVPMCPECEGGSADSAVNGNCGCGFDWAEWTLDRYG